MFVSRLFVLRKLPSVLSQWCRAMDVTYMYETLTELFSHRNNRLVGLVVKWKIRGPSSLETGFFRVEFIPVT